MAKSYATTVSSVGRKDILAMLGVYWRDVRFEYSGGNILYRGVNVYANAETSATDWEVWKFTWTGYDITRIQGPLTGSWDNRASLEWS